MIKGCDHVKMFYDNFWCKNFVKAGKIFTKEDKDEKPEIKRAFGEKPIPPPSKLISE